MNKNRIVENRIVADPEHCYGAPRIDGTRMPTDLVASMFRAGDSVSDIADWHELSVRQVEEALRFELMTSRQREKYLAGLDPFTRVSHAGSASG